jgi:hypothetical protein
MSQRLRPLLALMAALAIGTAGAPAALAQAGAAPAAASTEAALKANLEKSLQAFNRGDFQGYLHDFAAKLGYNGVTVDRARLVEINQELKQSFPNLKMSYKSTRINPMGETEANVTTVAEFTGSTKSYDGSGLAATYREAGEVTASYERTGEGWRTDSLQVAWNDSFIDIGRAFGVMGFTTLPVLLGADQPFRMRLFVGEDSVPGVGVSYAYAAVPLETLIAKTGAEEVFRALKFVELPAKGLDTELRAPAKAGTYAHVLVVNKFWRGAGQESLLGQKIYTRLVRVE